MAQLAKKHQTAFYEAQEQVAQLLRPYLARCISQYFGQNDAIETFGIYSKEEDAGEGRHKYRGIVTVWYGMPHWKDERCSVNFSFSENFLFSAVDMKPDYSWDGTKALLEKTVPALPT